MQQSGSQWKWLIKRLVCLLAATVIVADILGTVLTHADSFTAAPPAWALPGVMAIKKAGPVNSAQHEPNFLGNLDCNLMDYRLSDGRTMGSGCFTPTAFGLMDVDSGVIVFNGTDEGLQLLPYSAQQGVVPWTQALGVITLEPVSTGGSYIGMYKNPLAALRDQRDSLARLTAKQLTAPPDMWFKDPSGKLLVVNAQTIAFSDSGSWLVAETLNGAFVRINLAPLDVTAFAPSFGTTGSPGLLRSQVAVSSNGRYVAIDNDAASVLRVYDLATCDSVAVNLLPQKCTAYDYLPFVRQQVAGFHALRHLRFVDDGLLSFDVQTDDPNGGGIYELAPKASIKSLIDYLALGDSYTSGEGAFDYLSGTDTADDMCHLSTNSYPLLLTRALFSSAGGHSVACSGAVIDDVGSTSPSYRGQVRGVAPFDRLSQAQTALLNSIMTNYVPGYIVQQRFERQYQPAVMTVSVGGDDIGFGDIIKNCVMPHISLHLSDNTCYATYEDRLELTDLIDRTLQRWAGLYKQLQAESPDTRLYIVGYPQIATDSGSCGINVHLNKSELSFAEELIDYLNGSIRQAAIKAGVVYVDIGQALAGHRLCEAAGYDIAVNGLTAGNDGSVLGVRIFGKESYHPNALGQALIEQAIIEQTHNLELAVTPGGNPGVSSQAILQAPKSGRIVNTLVPDNKLTAGIVRSGQAALVQAAGVQDGLKPDTAYAVKLDGANGPIVGTGASDNMGNVSVSVVLPGNTPAGSHTIDLTGENQAGKPVDVTQPVIVPATGSDSDGDGIQDAGDSCPGALNSGMDSDQDGIDDVCDGLISPVLGVGQGGSPASDLAQAGDSIGGNMNAPAIVTSFEPVGYGNTRLPVSGAVLQNSNQIYVASRTLTTRPQPVYAEDVKQAGLLPGAGLAITVRSFTRLPAVNWLFWAIAWVVFLLLMLSGKIYQKMRFSTTIRK